VVELRHLKINLVLFAPCLSYEVGCGASSLTMKENAQKTMLRLLATKPISYNPELAKMLGSVKAGVLMSQLLYWWEKGSNPEWVYKTVDEMYSETGLTKKEQATAIRKCVEKGVLGVKLKGIPAKRHFKILERLVELAQEYKNA